MEFPCLIRAFLVKGGNLEHHYLLTPLAYLADFLSYCLSDFSPFNYVFSSPISVFALLNTSVSNNFSKNCTPYHLNGHDGWYYIWIIRPSKFSTLQGQNSIKLLQVELFCHQVGPGQNKLNCLARNTLYIFFSISIVNLFIQYWKYLVQSKNEQWVTLRFLVLLTKWISSAIRCSTLQYLHSCITLILIGFKIIP